MKLAPKTAVLIRDGKEVTVSIDDVQKGISSPSVPGKTSRWTGWW